MVCQMILVWSVMLQENVEVDLASRRTSVEYNQVFLLKCPPNENPDVDHDEDRLVDLQMHLLSSPFTK